MVSAPIFMANRWGNNGYKERLYFWGSKITALLVCSHEIKRCFLLRRNTMTNLDSILKSRDITLPDFPGGSDCKASAYNAGDLGSIPGLGRFPWRRKCQPTPVLLSGNSHGWRSLVGYSPWDCKESDTTEQLHIRELQSKSLGKEVFQEV